MDIARQIESFLLLSGGWVPTRLICERFDIPERRLRQAEDRQGLLDDFAVSSTCAKESGYIHHKFLPTEQWLPIKHRLRRHAISELRRVQRWSRARLNCTTGKRPGMIERHSGQMLFL